MWGGGAVDTRHVLGGLGIYLDPHYLKKLEELTKRKSVYNMVMMEAKDNIDEPTINQRGRK